MSSMNEDGNEHEPGGGRLGGIDQPNAPPPRYEPTTMKITPIPAADPGLAATAAAIPFVSGAAPASILSFSYFSK